MLCCAVLCCAVLCCAVLCCAALSLLVLAIAGWWWHHQAVCSLARPPTCPLVRAGVSRANCQGELLNTNGGQLPNKCVATVHANLHLWQQKLLLLRAGADAALPQGALFIGAARCFCSSCIQQTMLQSRVMPCHLSHSCKSVTFARICRYQLDSQLCQCLLTFHQASFHTRSSSCIPVF